MSEKSKTKKADSNGANGNGADEIIKIVGRLERAIDHADHTLASGSNITFDFTGCDFITVEGLEWLEEVLLRAESSQSKVRFANVQPPVYKVFKVAHIDSLLKACGAPASQGGPTC
jgi:hypothetical protein